MTKLILAPELSRFLNMFVPTLTAPRESIARMAFYAGASTVYKQLVAISQADESIPDEEHTATLDTMGDELTGYFDSLKARADIDGVLALPPDVTNGLDPEAADALRRNAKAARERCKANNYDDASCLAVFDDVPEADGLRAKAVAKFRELQKECGGDNRMAVLQTLGFLAMEAIKNHPMARN